MSYYMMPSNGLSPGYYQQLPPGTPGWQDAPVPGWGMNPLRAGPPRVGVGATPGCGSCGAYSDDVPLNSFVLPHYAPIGADAASEQTSYGVVALGIAGGIALGLAFAWLWFGSKKPAAMRANPDLGEWEAVDRGMEELRKAESAIKRGDIGAAERHRDEAEAYIGGGGFYLKGPHKRAQGGLKRLKKLEDDILVEMSASGY